MPRVTRKSLVESPAQAPSRMSPRASTKASTTSSRSSRSSTASTSTASPRTSRSRLSKSPGGEDQVEVEVPKTTARGRQQKPAGDASTPDEVLPEKTPGRGRSKVKETKTEDTAPETKASGRSRSRAKPAKNEIPQEEETVNTTSRGRNRTKTEEEKEESVEESPRGSRAKGKGKQAKVSEEKETVARASSRSRSSNKDQSEDSPSVNSRGRRGAKAEESTVEETAGNSQTKSRSRSRTKAEPKQSPEVEAESTPSRGRGRAKKSPTNESVGSSRSSSRSRTSKAQSEDIPEPVEVMEDVSKAKPKSNGSTKASSRRGASKVAAEEPEEKTDVTPTGRRSGRGRKVEASPTTPTKRRRVQGKSPADDQEEEPSDDQPVVQLEKLEEKMVADKQVKEDESKNMEVAEESDKQETGEKETSHEESMEDDNETKADKDATDERNLDKSALVDDAKEESMSPERGEVEEESKVSAVEEETKAPVVNELEKKSLPSMAEEKSEPPTVDKVEKTEEPKLAVEDEVIPVSEDENEVELESPVVDQPKASAEKVEEESKSPMVEEVKDTSQESMEQEKLANSQSNEKMDLDETDKETVLSSQESRSGGQKRKLETDDDLEESSKKRVCVDENKQEPISNVVQAVDKQTPHVEEPVIPVVQQPAIEAISDVSSAEEDMTCGMEVQNAITSQPGKTVTNQDAWQVPPVIETNAAVVEDISQDPIPSPKPTAEEPSDERLQAKPAGEDPHQETSQSMEKTCQEEIACASSTAQESKEEKEEDLAASYVIVNMDDVPKSDSTLVKDALPSHQNHTDKVQSIEDQHPGHESMEVDQVQTSDEQKKNLELTEKNTESNTMSKNSNTNLPVKPEVSITKPVRDFEPSPDIFHRTCVRNPTLVNTSVPGTNMFTVASYNILAECHRKRGDYSFTEEKYLNQEYRHQLLMKELQYLDADILCLQEVNPEYYNTLLQPALVRSGYQGCFMKRTWATVNEGEATFFKTNRFSMESNKGFSLAELSKKHIGESGLSTEVQAAVEEYLERADVVNICRLKCKQTEKVLTIGNIHVVWDHLRSPDIQSIQIATAVKEVVTQAGSDSCPHILCGDFNSVPSSVGYQLAQDGYLSDTNIATLQAVDNLKLQSGSKALVNHLWGAFQHTSSNLTSAYLTCQGEEPEITTFNRHMLECVDYLFYGNVGLGVSDILRVVDRSVIEDTNGLPTQDIPSDHLSLKSTFFFK